MWGPTGVGRGLRVASQVILSQTRLFLSCSYALVSTSFIPTAPRRHTPAAPWCSVLSGLGTSALPELGEG